MLGLSGHWGERSLLAAVFITTAMLTGLAAAEDCFVDPPGGVRSVKDPKRPPAPKVKKQAAPLAAAVVPASDPIVTLPKPKPKPKLRQAPLAAPTQARIKVDCPKDPVTPTAVLNEAMSRPPRGESALLAAALQAPVLTPMPTDTALKSSGPAMPRGGDIAFWPVAPVWQMTRDNTALLSSGASQAPALPALPAPISPPDTSVITVAPTTIPEPGTVSLLLVALVFMALRRGRI